MRVKCKSALSMGGLDPLHLPTVNSTKNLSRVGERRRLICFLTPSVSVVAYVFIWPRGRRLVALAARGISVDKEEQISRDSGTIYRSGTCVSYLVLVTFTVYLFSRFLILFRFSLVA